MNPPTVFLPARRMGIVLHTALVLVLLAGAGVCAFLALQQQVGIYFVLLMLAAVAMLAPLALVIYRGYALLNARYTLERDGLRLRWGLRAEDIPLPDVEWVRPASDLGFRLPLPPLSMAGAILGERVVPGLGRVEFMASDRSTLLIIATTQSVFAVSPADPAGFLRAFQYSTEMGSITPINSFSTQPAAYLQQVWGDRWARWLTLAGLLLVVGLFIQVSLLIPGRSSVSLGFYANGTPVEPGPAETLLLLPILAAFMYSVDLLGGLFYYRRPGQRSAAYLFWAGSLITPILLLIATLFIT